MDFSLKSIILLGAILLTGLSAGLFYAWEVSVIPGTKQISHKSYLEAMQAINRAILNPAFYLIFFGSLLMMIGSSYLQYTSGTQISMYLMLVATLSYLLGTFAVTVFGNVPLNEGLDVLDLLTLSREALIDTRMAYEKSWNRFHSIRTAFSVLAFALSLLTLYFDQS